MGTTTNYGLRYPEPTDNVELWTHIENLADDVDTAIADTSGIKICKLRQSAAQAFGDTLIVQVSYSGSSEDSDSLGWHSNVTNPTRITPDRTGWFEVGAVMNWEFNTAIQYCDMGFKKNGTIVDRHGNIQFPATGQNNVAKAGGTLILPMTVDTVGDYFEHWATQASGGSRNSNGGGGVAAPRFWMRYLGPL